VLGTRGAFVVAAHRSRWAESELFSARETGASGKHLCPQVEPGQTDENGVVGYERDVPADRSGSNPQIGVVEPLMQA